MDIKTATLVCKNQPAHHSTLFIGQHGVGKSQLVRQLAAHFHGELVKEGKIPADLPVADAASSEDDRRVECFLIDKRLSQMSEGDMIGLPELTDGVTRFCPPDWFMQACQSPRIIFLDEINRATPEVMQAAFQVVLDYELNGFKLHEDTRVYAAVNPDQGNYAVNGMDDALLDRFAVIELQPTAEDWFDWASGKGPGKGDIMPQIVQFLKKNRDYLDPPENTQPGKVYQSRRSWHMLDTALRHAGLQDNYEKNDLFFALALARVGAEAATSFVDFVATMDRQVSAVDILNKWSKKLAAQVEDLGAERYNIVIDQLGEHCKKNKWTKKQVTNLGKFAAVLPGEHCVNLWSKVAAAENVDNMIAFHGQVAKLMVKHLRPEDEASDTKDS